MTRADELLALADACEKATSPDREVDAAIEVACRIFPPYAPKWARDWAGRVIAQGARCYLEHDDGQLGAHWSPSEYTASLDAAKKLTPEGCFLRLYGEFPQAIIVRWDGRAYQEVARSLCALTDETAVVSANLRALAAIEKGAAA